MKVKIRKIIWCALITANTFILSSCSSQEQPPEILAEILLKDTVEVVLALENAIEVIEEEIVVKRKPLKLIIKQLASPTAPVIVGIYRSKHKFLSKESRLKEYTFIPKNHTLTVFISDIDYSEIAIAVYQDMNSNGQFDKNFLGLPKEGYAFSNNFKPTIKAPDYDDCKFNYDSTSCMISMNLIK